MHKPLHMALVNHEDYVYIQEMKTITLRLFVLSIGFFLLFPQRALAESNSIIPKSDQSILRCILEIEPGRVSGCFFPGPLNFFSRSAQANSIPPKRPLPAQPADKNLAVVPYMYARVISDNAPVFASLDAAVAGEPVLRTIETGFDFVTYIDAAVVNDKKYYMIDPGIWMRGSDLSRIGATGSFQGLVFSQTPGVQFGWVRNEIEAKRTPGYTPNDGTGKIYYRYDVVQIYSVKKIDQMDWYLVGPDEWLEGRQVGRVIPKTQQPEGVKNGRWIEVNLAEQTVAVYDKTRLVFATMVATGSEGSWTQPGLFQIYKKVDAETMYGAFTADRSDYYYLEDVPWTMYFDQARALHGTYWHNRFGWPQSRGCVNLSPGDANWLFQWAKEGDWVYVWDPSGQTPTDPNLYGGGGA